MNKLKKYLFLPSWGIVCVVLGLILLEIFSKLELSKLVKGNAVLEVLIGVVNIICSMYVSSCVWRQGRKDFNY